MNAIDPAEYGVTGRAEVVATLSRIVMLRSQKKAIEDELAGLEQAVRIELGNDPEPLVDGEHGIVATLIERKAPARIDTATPAGEPWGGDVLCHAASAGLITVALTPLRALKGKVSWADALLRYEMPGGVQQMLKIEET